MNSTEINTLDFSVFCRTCLRNESSLMPLYDSKAAEMLKDCNFCNVSTNDGGPDKICISCLEILEQSYNFKQLCQKSESVLEKALSRNNQQFVFCKETQRVVLRNNLEECNTQESSLDSSDLRDDLRRNDFLNKITEINKTEENPADFTEGERHVSEDFISFLDIPLPPPLQHQCQNCSQSFSEENDLKVHQSVHNSDLTCLACSKKFSGRQSLKRHLKIHLIKKPHICSVCSKSFSESYALVKHLRHHSGIPREKKHFCGECGQGFSEPYYLKVHMRKHTGERPLECPNCDKTFADPRSLRAHIMIHTGQRPYKCSYCSKGFVQNANLTKHLRVHTGEKPYACDLCNKKFTQSSSLEKHRATHCNKTYGCSSCSKRFSKKSDLRKHESVHGKEGVTYN